MVPKVQPPPLVESMNTKINTKALLEDLVHKLHVLIYKIPLPKTKTAKTAIITIESLHLMRDLVKSASTQMKEPHKGPSLEDISHQLEAIQTHLDTNGIPLKPQKLSYAATLATDTKTTPSGLCSSYHPKTTHCTSSHPLPSSSPPKTLQSHSIPEDKRRPRSPWPIQH